MWMASRNTRMAVLRLSRSVLRRRRSYLASTSPLSTGFIHLTISQRSNIWTSHCNTRLVSSLSSEVAAPTTHNDEDDGDDSGEEPSLSVPSEPALGDLVEEILTFQDDIGNPGARERWEREYKVLLQRRQLKSTCGTSLVTTMEEDGDDESDEKPSASHLSNDDSKRDDDRMQHVDDIRIPGRIQHSFSRLVSGNTDDAVDGSKIDTEVHNIEVGEAASQANVEELSSDELDATHNHSDDLRQAADPNRSSGSSDTQQTQELEVPCASYVRALALLRSMRSSEWESYDNLDLLEDSDIQDDEIEIDDVDMDDVIASDGDNDLDGFDRLQEHHVDKDSLADHPRENTPVVTRDRQEISLSTRNCNETLLRLTLSSELQQEEILKSSMMLFERMQHQLSDTEPDPDTYEILLLALRRRLVFSRTAVELVSRMVETHVEWTQDTLLAALPCLGRDHLDLAMTVLRNFAQDPNRKGSIHESAFISVLNVARSLDGKQAALEILELCLKVGYCRVWNVTFEV